MLDKKLHYKLEILYTKWSPFIISGLLVIYHICSFLFPYDFTWILFICLPSLFTSVHMYNSRETFMLCKVHRCFVNYVVCNNIAAIIDHYYIDAYKNNYWFTFVIIGTILALLIGLYYYTDEHGKNNSKNAS